jgi:F-type H+-transporting ATPase subunit b
MAQEPASAAHHDEEGDPRLMLKWANFAILAGLAGWLISKTLPPFFKSRSEEITKGIAEATKLKADAEAKAAAIEKRLAQLGTEIELLRANAKQEMQIEADRIKRETENYLAKIHEGGLSEIEAASKRAQAELKAQAASEAIDLAEQRIRAGLQNGGGLVERFISDLGKKGSNN